MKKTNKKKENKILKKKKKSFNRADKFLIKITAFYLFPLYVVGKLLKFFDKAKVVVIDFVKYKILKRKREQKAEDWWII